ncbi:MAG: hypothetical protein AB1607_03430 [Chloroflexota bacterium]
MNIKKLLFSVTLIIITMALLPSQANADSAVPPFDFAIFTADKKYIFVMLVPPEETTRTGELSPNGPPYYPTVIYDSDEPWINGTEQADDSLRIKYPCSGLYKNNGSNRPIWTVDWYSYSVYLFPDGEHLIRLGPWNSIEFENGEPSFNGLAFAFYKNGVEVAQYKVKDVVKDTNAISFSVSHYMWLKDQHIDKSNGLLYVETRDNQKYTYDVREMARSIKGHETSCKPNHKYVPENTSNSQYTVTGAAFAVILATGVIFWLRKRRRLI